MRSRRGVILDNSHALRRRDMHAENETRGPEYFAGTTGLDLVWLLRRMGFTVRVQTLSEAWGAPIVEYVGTGLIISWVNTTDPFPGFVQNQEVELEEQPGPRNNI